jgi:hypothetical protein
VRPPPWPLLSIPMTDQEAADRDSRDDERRWFHAREFKALLAAQDGRCADCGEVLGPLDTEHVFWGDDPDTGDPASRLLCPGCAQPAPKLSPSEVWHQAMQILINRTPQERADDIWAARERLGLNKRCSSPMNNHRHLWTSPERLQCKLCGYTRTEVT